MYTTSWSSNLSVGLPDTCVGQPDTSVGQPDTGVGQHETCNSRCSCRLGVYSA